MLHDVIVITIDCSTVRTLFDSANQKESKTTIDYRLS